MKIQRTEFKAVAQTVEDTIAEVASVPVWIAETVKESCDCCQYPFDRQTSLTALRLTSGTVMLIHNECLQRLTKS